MSTIHVPHLQTFHFIHDAIEAVVFAEDKHRTFFGVQDTDAQNLHMWIGLDPDPDVENWFSLGGSTTRDTFIFDKGVFGPIYLSEGTGVSGEIFVLSNLTESPTIVPLANL